MNEAEESKKDFEKSLDLVPDFVQSLVKIASVHMELRKSRLPLSSSSTADLCRGPYECLWRLRDCHPIQPQRS